MTSDMHNVHRTLTIAQNKRIWLSASPDTAVGQIPVLTLAQNLLEYGNCKLAGQALLSEIYFVKVPWILLDHLDNSWPAFYAGFVKPKLLNS